MRSEAVKTAETLGGSRLLAGGLDAVVRHCCLLFGGDSDTRPYLVICIVIVVIILSLFNVLAGYRWREMSCAPAHRVDSVKWDSLVWIEICGDGRRSEVR